LHPVGRSVFGDQQVLVQRRVREGQPLRQTARDRQRLQNVRRLVRMVELR
jgi:hypothetical protein